MNAPSSEFRNEYERVTGFDVEEFTGSHDVVKVAAATPAALKNERLKILFRRVLVLLHIGRNRLRLLPCVVALHRRF
jgi:hypothetical protein